MQLESKRICACGCGGEVTSPGLKDWRYGHRVKCRRICVICGDEFAPHHAVQPTCSHKCGLIDSWSWRPRILASTSTEYKFWAKQVCGLTPQACYAWTGACNGGGYGVVGVRRKTGRGWINNIASRIAWELAFGPIPDDLWVLHHCDNPPCTNPLHLFLGTALDNNRDSVAKGRHVTAYPSIRGDLNYQRKYPELVRWGEAVGTSKLKIEQVEWARQTYEAGGRSQQSIADELGVSQVLISHIIRRTAWKRA